MNVINFKRVRDELKKSFSMDRDGSAIVLDLTSGELVAFTGAVSYSKAADRAGSFYVIWNAQDQSASQHDNKLEVQFVQITSQNFALKLFLSLLVSLFFLDEIKYYFRN